MRSVALFLVFASSGVGAASPPELEPVGGPDYVVIGLGAALLITGNVIQPTAQRPAARVDFDERARSAVRLDSLTARFAIRDVSDLTLSILLIAPLLGDALLNVAWARNAPRAAWRMAIIDLEALAITGALQGLTSMLVSRERPYGRECGGEVPSEAFDCRVQQQRYRSFFSGHASFTFTAAALTCSHHVRLDLFGGGGAEVGTCVAGFALAAATATFRMMGDMHYATDVLTGAAIGTLVGFLVPALHRSASDRDLGRPPPVQLTVVPSGAGVSLVGAW